MRKIYFLKEDGEMMELLHEAKDDLLAVLEQCDSHTRKLLEDTELSQLHMLLVLIRMGYIHTQWVQSFDHRMILLEIKD